VSVPTLKPFMMSSLATSLAGLGIDAGVLDAVAGVPVDLVEADLFGIGRGRIERDRAGDERKAQEAFPVGAGGHGRELRLRSDSRRTSSVGSDTPPLQLAIHS
jgi:hypothetical protein